MGLLEIPFFMSVFTGNRIAMLLELARADEEHLSVLSTTNDIKYENASDMIGWMEWHAESIAPKT